MLEQSNSGYERILIPMDTLGRGTLALVRMTDTHRTGKLTPLKHNALAEPVFVAP